MTKYIYKESFRKSGGRIPKLIKDDPVSAIYVYIDGKCYIFVEEKDAKSR